MPEWLCPRLFFRGSLPERASHDSSILWSRCELPIYGSSAANKSHEVSSSNVMFKTMRGGGRSRSRRIALFMGNGPLRLIKIDSCVVLLKTPTFREAHALLVFHRNVS